MKKGTKRVLIITICAVLVAAISTGVAFAVNSKNKPEQQISAEVSSIAEISSEEITADSESESAEESVYEESEPEQIEEETEQDEVTEESEETEVNQEAYNDPFCKEGFIRLNPWLENYIPTAPEPDTVDDKFYENVVDSFFENIDPEKYKESNGIELTPEMKKHIKCDLYCGTYNGYSVVYIANGVFDTYHTYKYDKITDEVTVVYSDYSQDYYLYKDGEFVPLSSAYNQGIISETDLKDIVYYIGAKKLSYNELMAAVPFSSTS